jgi:hypothetical protein
MVHSLDFDYDVQGLDEDVGSVIAGVELRDDLDLLASFAVSLLQPSAEVFSE